MDSSPAQGLVNIEKDQGLTISDLAYENLSPPSFSSAQDPVDCGGDLPDTHCGHCGGDGVR